MSAALAPRLWASWQTDRLIPCIVSTWWLVPVSIPFRNFSCPFHQGLWPTSSSTFLSTNWLLLVVLLPRPPPAPALVQRICVVPPFPADLLAPTCQDLSRAVFPLWWKVQHKAVPQVWKPLHAPAECGTDSHSTAPSLTSSHPWGLQLRNDPFPSRALQLWSPHLKFQGQNLWAGLQQSSCLGMRDWQKGISPVSRALVQFGASQHKGCIDMMNIRR